MPIFCIGFFMPFLIRLMFFQKKRQGILNIHHRFIQHGGGRHDTDNGTSEPLQ